MIFCLIMNKYGLITAAHYTHSAAHGGGACGWTVSVALNVVSGGVRISASRRPGPPVRVRVHENH